MTDDEFNDLCNQDTDTVHCTLCGAPIDLCFDLILVEAQLPKGQYFNDPEFMGCGQLKLCITCAAACTEAIRQYYHDAGVCEHGEREGDWCAECNAAYKMARVEDTK